MKNILLGTLGSFLVFSSFVLPAPAATSDAGPNLTPEGKALSKHLSQLFEESKNVNAKGAAKTKARSAIEGAMDWDRIAKDCLPEAEWKKQQSSGGHKNISEFKALLKEVIVKTAYTRLDTFWKNASYTFSKMDITGDKAHVQAVFDVKDKEGNEKFTLDYYLLKRDKKWVIYDVAFEEVRYSENIREQIKTFLGEQGFPSLLSKLRDRKKELNESKG